MEEEVFQVYFIVTRCTTLTYNELSSPPISGWPLGELMVHGECAIYGLGIKGE